MTDILFLLRSRCRAVITGEEPERFLNLAAAKGIYVSDVRPCNGGLRIRLSRRAWEMVKDELPEGLEMRITGEYGAARFFRKYKGRALLLGHTSGGGHNFCLYSVYMACHRHRRNAGAAKGGVRLYGGKRPPPRSGEA